jgi:hypothetical protein
VVTSSGFFAVERSSLLYVSLFGKVGDLFD